MCYYNVPDISLSLSHTHTYKHTHIPKKSWMVESGGISAAQCKPLKTKFFRKINHRTPEKCNTAAKEFIMV
jgi:hypothetical protein